MKGWPVVELGSVAEVAAGQGAPQAEADFGTDGLPFVRAGSLESLLEGRREGDLPRVSSTKAKEHGLRVFPAGTVVFAKSGMSSTLGRVYSLREDAYLVNHLAALRPSSKVDGSFLVHWLRANPPSRLIKDKSYPSIRLSDVGAVQIALPPLAEQRRIAAILDKADAMRRKRAQATKMVDDLLRGVFLEIFGDPVTNPKGWPSEELLQVADIGSGIMKGRKMGGRKVVDLPYLRVANVQDGYLNLDEIKTIPVPADEADKYALRAGDVLMTEGGDYDKLGRGAVWRGEIEPCVHQNHIYRIRPHRRRVAPDYLSALAGSGYGKAYFMRCAKQTTGIATINKTQLGRFPVLLPPVKQQQQFGRVVAQVRSATADMISTTASVEQLTASLQRSAFGLTGRE